MDTQKDTGLSAQNSHSLTSDGYTYDPLLSKHLSSSRRKSLTTSQSASISHHNLENKSQSYAGNHPPFTATGKCWDQKNNLGSNQLGFGIVPPSDPPSLCKPRSSRHPHCGSIPTLSHGSHGLDPSQSIISQDPILPMSPRSKAIIPPVVPVVPLGESNPSSYSNSEDEDFPFNREDSGQCSLDYSDDGDDLSDESGEYSASDISEDSDDSDDSSENSDDDIYSDSFVDSDSTRNASSDFSIAGNIPEVIFTPYECKLFDDSSWYNNISKDYVQELSQCVLHSNHSSDAEGSLDILQSLQCVPFSTNSHNTGSWYIYHHSSKSYVGTNDCPSTDDSDQQDFLQLGASKSTIYVSSPYPNYIDIDNTIVSLQMLAQPITTASSYKALNSGNSSSENTITKTEDTTYPFILSE